MAVRRAERDLVRPRAAHSGFERRADVRVKHRKLELHVLLLDARELGLDDIVVALLVDVDGGTKGG